jgi:sensor histidine kinase YesM
VAAIYWEYLGCSGRKSFNFFVGALEYISDVALYILITHLYRNFSLRHHWQLLNISQLLKRLIPAVVVMGAVFMLTTILKVYLFHQWLSDGNAGSFAVFFKTNWVQVSMTGIRLLSIWLLAFHLYYYGKREINLTKENVRLALIAKDAQLNNLSAQLNPHFFFNSLNTIKALVIESPKSARRAIDLLSDLLRTSLYNDSILLHTIQDELGLARDYLELEKLRLEERLQFEIECAPDLYDILILRYSIQVLVENAVKHGISKQKSGGLIDIKIRRDVDGIKISVQNPGKLEASTPFDGLGLKNLNERLLLQYKGRAAFIISEQLETVSAYILIPAI